MKANNSFIDYLRLLRPQGASATASTILIGGMIMGLRDYFLLFILFIIGVLSHIVIFVLNEYADIMVDKTSINLQKKPLVSGSIPKDHALLIIICAGFCIYILTTFYFYSIYSLAFLSIALLLGSFYDIYGKRIFGSDAFIAGACFFICFFGASTVSIQFTNLVSLVAFSCFFHIIFNNAVEGGLKDIDHDLLAGAKTTATRMGIHIKDNALIITKKFSVFAYIIKIIYIGLVIIVGLQPEINLWRFEYFVIHIFIIILILIAFISLYKFWHPADFNRSRLIHVFAIHEISTYFLGPIVLIPLIGATLALLLLLIPLFWFIFCNILLYGKVLHPLV
jgi:4-hydroxybenzoate polyprenyltransferase